MNVEVLARLYALHMLAGSWTWGDMLRRIVAPRASLQDFWTCCSSMGQRHMAAFMLGHALMEAPSLLQQRCTSMGTISALGNTPQLLQVWLFSMVDYGKRACLEHLCMVIARPSLLGADLLQGCVLQRGSILSDSAGMLRAQLLRHVLQRKQGSHAWRGVSFTDGLLQVRHTRLTHC